eukprot:jgi/Ulvmu1/4150/UM019_0129.1
MRRNIFLFLFGILVWLDVSERTAAGSVDSAGTFDHVTHAPLPIDITGIGAHRQLSLRMPSAAEACPQHSTAADMCLSMQLPAALYFDPYELDRVLRRQRGWVVSRSLVDVEMPEVASVMSSVLLRLQLDHSHSIVHVPIHSKYAAPFLQPSVLQGQIIHIKPPIAAYTCNEALCTLNSNEVVLRFTTFKEWIIPVENISMLKQVAVVTQCCQCALTILVVLVSAWRSWLQGTHGSYGLKGP